MQTAKMHDGHELVPHPLKKGQILMVCTSSAGDDGSKTGAWLAEFAVPYYAFKEAGYDVTLASTHGGDIPLDKTSLHPLKDAAAQRFLDDDEAQVQLRHSVPLSSVAAPTEYDCVYLAGGHGAMWDMPEDTKLQDILQRAWAAGNIVATVCHGPAGLVGAVDEDGKPLVAGKKMTCFSDAEEAAMGLLGKSSPFKLQTKLQELGADVSPGLPMTSCVHRDGQLITGQNPVSLQKLTEEVIKALNERRNNVSSPAK